MGVAAPPFAGFRPEAVQFLADLAANNDRAWFQPRKADYERLLKEPLEAFVAALAERFEERGIPLHADPARSPFRIYRDVRFSKDKSPYKTNLGAGFPWVEGRPIPVGGRRSEAGNAHAFGGYFHFQPGEIYVGGGMWRPEKPLLEAWRRAVIDRNQDVHAAIDDPGFRAFFDGVETHDTFRRMPPGYPADHPDAELLRYKDVVFGRRLSDKEALSPRLPDMVADGYAASVPMFRFLDSMARG